MDVYTRFPVSWGRESFPSKTQPWPARGGLGHGERHRCVGAVPKGQGPGCGAGHSPGTWPRGPGLSSPLMRSRAVASVGQPYPYPRGPDHSCKYNSTAPKHTLHETPAPLTGRWRATQPPVPPPWREGGEGLRAAGHLELIPSPAAASPLTGAHLGLVA